MKFLYAIQKQRGGEQCGGRVNIVHLIFISSEYFILYPEKCSPIIYIAPPFWFNLIYPLPSFSSHKTSEYSLFFFLLLSRCDSVLWYCSKRFAIPQKKKIIYENYHGNLLYFLIIPLSFFPFVSFFTILFWLVVVVLHKSLVK